MVNTLGMYMSLLRGLMKLAGVRQTAVEIEPGTVMHFWSPTETTSNKGNKPAVVFLHGFGLNGILAWHFQVLALAKEYAVYVPDFLFFGGSFTDKTERSPAFQAKCVARGLEKLGVEKCVLVGSSYGGMVGFKMAEMYPELVESMVATCSVMALTESITRDGTKRIGMSSWAEILLPDSANGLKRTFTIVTHKLPWIPDFVYKDALEAMDYNRKERHELLEALITRDEDFTVPQFSQVLNVCLMYNVAEEVSSRLGGERLHFDLEIAHQLKEQLKGKATLHCIEKAGHLVNIERPCVYNRLLKSILACPHQAESRKYN